MWAELCQCSFFQDRGIGLQSLHWIQTAFLSGVLDETDDWDLSVEDGAGGGSDCEARRRESFEVND